MLTAAIDDDGLSTEKVRLSVSGSVNLLDTSMLFGVSPTLMFTSAMLSTTCGALFDEVTLIN